MACLCDCSPFPATCPIFTDAALHLQLAAMTHAPLLPAVTPVKDDTGTVVKIVGVQVR